MAASKIDNHSAHSRLAYSHLERFQRAASETARHMSGPVDRMDFDRLALEVQAVDRSQADSLEIDSPDFDSPDFETVDRRTLAEPAQAAGFPKLADARKSAAQKDCASSAARLVLVLSAELARPPFGHID